MMKEVLICAAILLVIVAGVYAMTHTQAWKDARESEAACWAMGYQDSLYHNAQWWCIDSVERIRLEPHP